MLINSAPTQTIFGVLGEVLTPFPIFVADRSFTLLREYEYETTPSSSSTMASNVPAVSGAGAAPAAGFSAVVAAPAGVAAVTAAGAAAFGAAAGAVPAGPRAADFDNPAVLNAGPASVFGYHHGPIPNANHGWQPPRQRQAVAANKRVPDVSVDDNALAPNPMARLSPINTLVCEIVVAPATGQMCGRVFSDTKKLHRHARTSHPGAVENRDHQAVSPAEVRAGHDALRHHVLSLGWRNADFKTETGFGQLRQFGSLVVGFADQCEEIARADPIFAGRFGTTFHRRGPQTTPAAAAPAAATTTSSHVAIGDDLTINGQLPATNLPPRPSDFTRAAIRRLARRKIVENDNEFEDETYDEELEPELALKKAEAKEKRFGPAPAVPVLKEGEEEYESDDYYSDKEAERKEAEKKKKEQKMARRAELPGRTQRPPRFLGPSQTHPFALLEDEE